MKAPKLVIPVLLAASFAEEIPLALAAPQQLELQYAIMRTQPETPQPVFAPVVRRYRRHVRYRRYAYVKRRSRAKSAAIVGGSALGGAAIGGLAGGGKGAAVGALAGGAAGLIYDRKTHKKVVRE
jgi:uncharacterized protein YcfJ